MCEVVFTNKVVLKAETIEQLPELKYIGVLATGTNVVDLILQGEGNLRDQYSWLQYGLGGTACPCPVVPFQFQGKHHNDAVHEGNWVNSKDFCFTLGTLNELSAKTLGIIGLGTIGRKLAKVADAMGMKVIAAISRV